jgi:uncharacterized membrane-anchored protein
MQRKSLLFICLFLLFSPLGQANDKPPQLTPEQEKYIEQARALWNSLDRKTGEIVLPDGVATLKVPDSFYYLNPDDTEKVLTKVWGNPPSPTKMQGMLFPADMTPFDRDAWGVTINYSEDGYVSDKDADTLNYDDLLQQMKDATVAGNKERIVQGYEPIELVGWASRPYYDKTEHKLHWAKEIKFGKQPVNTLNYNIRVLGRKGFLELNFIAGMDQKAMIDQELNTVLAMASFNPGYRYSDFNPSLDKVAAYGIGGLVAGTILSKTGMLAAALLLLKKFWILIVAGGAGVLRMFKRKSA